jgi:hypothetical protein
MVFSVFLKQTAVFGVAPLLLFALRRQSVRKTAVDAAYAICFGFLLTAPFIAVGYSPSLLYGTIGIKMNDFTSTSKIVKFDNVASKGAFNIWPLITYLLGHRGYWDRFWLEDSIQLPLNGPTLLRWGLFIFGIYAVAFMFIILRSAKQSRSSEELFRISAAFTLGAMILLTRVATRYFLIPIAFLTLDLAWRKSKCSIGALLILTVTSFIGLYGDLTIQAMSIPGMNMDLSPSRNPVNAAFWTLYTQDPYITLLSALNVVAFLLVLLSLRANQVRKNDQTDSSVPLH